MYKSFFHTSNFDFEKFISYLPNKENTILDYGCGNGIFYNKNLKHKKIKLIKMIDKDKKLKTIIKKKYFKNQKVIWTNTINGNYDVVLINSVIQYLSFSQYKKLINSFFKKKIKIILISDIPKFPRFLEAILLLFLNPKKLINGLSYLFEKNYLKIGFFYKKYEKLRLNNYNYNFEMKTNLNDDKLLRYTLVIQKK